MGAKQPFPGGSWNRNDCGEFWTLLVWQGLDCVHKNTVFTAARRPVNSSLDWRCSSIQEEESGSALKLHLPNTSQPFSTLLKYSRMIDLLWNHSLVAERPD